MSEELIIRHCSPTLAGIKTGNLFSCTFTTIEQLHTDIRALNRRLANKGLLIMLLRIKNDRALIYVYRPSKLKSDLSQKEVADILAEYGYNADTPDNCVFHLRTRLNMVDDFPHEIGLFLGYPAEDVRGFIENGSHNSKCVGCWKVYGDVDKAKVLFAKYKKCTEIYVQKFSCGSTLDHLTVAI